MILVDTSVWIDHLRSFDAQLFERLDEAVVCTHPMVIGELALGSLRDRRSVLDLLMNLPSTLAATHAEVLAMIEALSLYGAGLGLVDAHLLAAARIDAGVRLWTRDRRLLVAAERLGVAADV